MATRTSAHELSRFDEPRRALNIRSKPIRTVLGWQAATTVAAAAVAGSAAGTHGALSAALGGAVNIAATVVFAFVTSFGKSRTATGTLLTAMRAEAAKVAAIVLLLWLVFARYHELVVAAFIGTFILTVIVFTLAFFVRDASGSRSQD